MLCLLSGILTAVLPFPSAGSARGASACAHCRASTVTSVFSARGGISLCFLSPSNTIQMEYCGVTADALYPLLTTLFLLPVACTQWFCLPDFECLLSPFFFCYRHMFQRAFSFIFLNFGCMVSRPLAKSQDEGFFGGVDGEKRHLWRGSRLLKSGFARCIQCNVYGSKDICHLGRSSPLYCRGLWRCRVLLYHRN